MKFEFQIGNVPCFHLCHDVVVLAWLTKGTLKHVHFSHASVFFQVCSEK